MVSIHIVVPNSIAWFLETGMGAESVPAQLRQVTDALKMRPVETMPALSLTEAMIHGALLRKYLLRLGLVRLNTVNAP
jgi:hypothetical protein